jgi:hypothetical protein
MIDGAVGRDVSSRPVSFVCRPSSDSRTIGRHLSCSVPADAQPLHVRTGRSWIHAAQILRWPIKVTNPCRWRNHTGGAQVCSKSQQQFCSLFCVSVSELFSYRCCHACSWNRDTILEKYFGIGGVCVTVLHWSWLCVFASTECRVDICSTASLNLWMVSTEQGDRGICYYQ